MGRYAPCDWMPISIMCLPIVGKEREREPFCVTNQQTHVCVCERNQPTIQWVTYIVLFVRRRHGRNLRTKTKRTVNYSVMLTRIVLRYPLCIMCLPIAGKERENLFVANQKTHVCVCVKYLTRGAFFHYASWEERSNTRRKVQNWVSPSHEALCVCCSSFLIRGKNDFCIKKNTISL